MASNASRRAATLKNPRLLKHLGTNGNIRRRDGLSARGASAHDLVDRPPPLGTRVLARRALRSRHAGAERGSSSRSRRLPGRRVGRHLPRATHRADGGRAPSGRGHKPHRPAVGHGHVARRHRAWTLGAGSGVARLAARHLSERARAESHARWHRAVRHSSAAAADRDGD